MSDETKEVFEGWAILELMGHRKLAGYIREHTIGGTAFVRIDVPSADGSATPITATQFYAPAAIYCITPTTEAFARKIAQGAQPAPVTRWELPEPSKPVREIITSTDDDEQDDDDDDESANDEIPDPPF